MRATATVLAAVCGLTILVGAAQAAPITLPGSSGNPAITLIAEGCGPGFHRRNWVDRYGRPRTECVPNGYGYGPRPARRCAPGWHWREWRGPAGRLHAECVPNR